MMLISSSILSRPDGMAIEDLGRQISEHSPILNPNKNWNGFNILHTEASRPGALDLGIPCASLKQKDLKLIYLLGIDDLRPSNIPENSFVIYSGSHGDQGALLADLVLPGCSYLEKMGTYVNTDGRVQITRKVHPPPGIAKEDWRIFRALSEEIGFQLPYDDLIEVYILYIYILYIYIL